MRTLSGLSVWGNPFVSTDGKDVLVSATTKLRQRQALLNSAEADQDSDSEESIDQESDHDSWPRLRIVLVEPGRRRYRDGDGSGRSSPRNAGPEFWDPEQPDEVAFDAWSSSSSVDSWDAASGDEDRDGTSDDVNLIDDIAAVEDDPTAQESQSEDETGEYHLQRALQASILEPSAASCVVHTTGFSPVRSSAPPENGSGSGSGSGSDSDSDSDHMRVSGDGVQPNEDEPDVRTGSRAATAACGLDPISRTKKRKPRAVMESDDEEDSDEE